MSAAVQKYEFFPKYWIQKIEIFDGAGSVKSCAGRLTAGEISAYLQVCLCGRRESAVKPCKYL
jgi:hypothetical protein